MKNAVYSHPASAILRSPPKRDVTHIDIYLSKRKNNRAVEPRTCTSSPYNPRRWSHMTTPILTQGAHEKSILVSSPHTPKILRQ